MGGTSFTYDGDNRLSTTTASGTSATYQYDGEGRRVTKTVNGVQTVLVYDASGRLIADYGPSSGMNGTAYVNADHLGSTRLLTDANGVLSYGSLCLPEYPPRRAGNHSG